MAELDATVKGLDCCQDETGESCRVCPYREHLNPTGGKPAGWCRFEVRRDALALLKEEEPRVMTREEVIDLLQGSVVWYEERSESGSFLRAMISDGNGFLGDFYLGVNANEVELKRQRFWTSRPSAEMMANTPWEGEKDD